MAVIAQESWEGAGPVGSPVDWAGTVLTNPIGAAPTVVVSPVDAGQAARFDAPAGAASAFLDLGASRSRLVHTWYTNFDGGTTTAGNAILSAALGGGAFRGQVTRRTTGRLALREVQVLAAETTGAWASGRLLRLVHTMDGTTQSLDVRDGATDEVLETITAPLAAGGVDQVRDGFINAPGGTLLMTVDRHVWDDAVDPGPYAPATDPDPVPEPEPTTVPGWSVLVAGVERPATRVSVLVGGVERPMTAHEVTVGAPAPKPAPAGFGTGFGTTFGGGPA